MARTMYYSNIFLPFRSILGFSSYRRRYVRPSLRVRSARPCYSIQHPIQAPWLSNRRCLLREAPFSRLSPTGRTSYIFHGNSTPEFEGIHRREDIHLTLERPDGEENVKKNED